MYIPDPSLWVWVWWVCGCGLVGVGVGVSWCIHRYYTSWSICGVSVYHVVPSSVDCLLDVGRGCACLTGDMPTCGS